MASDVLAETTSKKKGYRSRIKDDTYRSEVLPECDPRRARLMPENEQNSSTLNVDYKLGRVDEALVGIKDSLRRIEEKIDKKEDHKLVVFSIVLSALTLMAIAAEAIAIICKP